MPLQAPGFKLLWCFVASSLRPYSRIATDDVALVITQPEKVVEVTSRAILSMILFFLIGVSHSFTPVG